MRRLAERARRADRARTDSGHTLVEMLVVILILGIVMATVQGTVIVANKTSGEVSGRLTAANEGKIAIDSMSRNLRTAVLPQLVAGASCENCDSVAFVQGTPTSVQFYANNNDDVTRLGPSKVTYTLTDDVLHERIQKPDPHDPNDFDYTYCAPGPSCAASERVLARGVVSDRLFTYYDRGGSVLSSGSLNASQLSQVDSVDVEVRVVDKGQQTTLVQRVTLPNADSVPEVTPPIQ